MTQAFTGGKVSKSYLAVVRGFTNEAERIDHPLKERRDKMTGQKADRDKPGQDAVTEYRRLAVVELPHPVGRYSTARYSLVRAFPLTGRNHQIRRHMKHIFHPVINDTTYGDGKQNDFFRSHFNCSRLLLHAQEVEFVHPCSSLQVRVQAPLDQAFSAVLTALEWDQAVLL
jgi:tRNA pseudouridine65 synthase